MLCKFEQFLNNDPRLSKVLDNIYDLKKISNLFASLIGDDLSRHCKLAKIDNDKLIVIVDSSVWATRFKFSIPDILKNLNTQPEFKKIKTISYQVSIKNSMFGILKKKNNPKPILSRENAVLLKAIAAKIQNQKLKQGLEDWPTRFYNSITNDSLINSKISC